MSTKELGRMYKCDICEVTEVHSELGYRPNEFSSINITGYHSGFNYNKSFDVCNKCFPNSMWTDPPAKKSPPKSFIMKIYDRMKSAKWSPNRT